MGLAEMIQAYMEIGFLGLCAVVVVTMFYQDHKNKQKHDREQEKVLSDNFNNMNEKITDLTNQIQKQNDLLIQRQEEHYQNENERANELIKSIVNGVAYHVPSPEEEAKLGEINNKIEKTLQMLREDTNASRASIVQYHNGGKGINKQAFLRMSMTNEQVKLSVKPIISKFKDQYRTSLAYIVNNLQKHNKCFIENIEDLKNKDINTYEFMQNYDINSIYCKAVRNKYNNVIAFISLEFDGKDKADLALINDAFDKYENIITEELNK